VFVFDRDEAACARLKKDLPNLHGAILADVSDPDSVARAFGELDKLAGGLDILINNAGSASVIRSWTSRRRMRT